MAFLNIFIVTICFFFHDVPIADFNLFFSDKYVDIDILIEQKDLDKALDKSDILLSDKGIYKYLEEHFSVSINDISHQINYCDILEKNGHYYISGVFKIKVTSPSSVEINNSVLIDHIPHQTNNLYYSYRKIYRGFKLNKERTKTRFDIN